MKCKEFKKEAYVMSLLSRINWIATHYDTPFTLVLHVQKGTALVLSLEIVLDQ